MAEVRQTNPKAFAELNLKLKELDQWEMRVGWFPGAKYESGTPVAYVAAIQELGSGPIPPRPFMRPAQMNNQGKWLEKAAYFARGILAGKITGFDAMDLLGQVAREDVADAIIAVNSPPLSPLTLLARQYRRMGNKLSGKAIGMLAKKLDAGPPNVSGVSIKPLQDTGQMLRELTYTVTEKK